MNELFLYLGISIHDIRRSRESHLTDIRLGVFNLLVEFDNCSNKLSHKYRVLINALKQCGMYHELHDLGLEGLLQEAELMEERGEFTSLLAIKNIE